MRRSGSAAVATGRGGDEHQPVDAVGVADRELLADEATVGVAERSEAIDAEMVGERDDVVGELRHRQRLDGCVAGTTVAAVVEMDEPEIGGEGSERAPVHLMVETEAAVEHEARRQVNAAVDLVVQRYPVDGGGRHGRRS
jgi:hypothetical protein